MKNFYYYSKQFIGLLEKHKELFDFVFSINEKRNKFIIKPQEILNVSSNQGQQAAALVRMQQNVQNVNNEILTIIRTKRPNSIYDLINSFIQELNLFDTSYNDENSLIKEFKLFPEKHTDAYSEKQASNIFEVTELCYGIAQTINDVKEKSLFIIDEFDKSSKKLPIDYITLKIGTDQDIPLIEDFVIMLKSLEDLYNFICYIHKIDSEINHLIINQISTGSWYTELFGIKQVVISIENLLKGIGTFIRDYITGKIDREKFENECKKAEEFIHLISIAKKHGIDNAELGIFKNLRPLVDNFNKDTTVIDIDGEEILKLRKNEKLTLVERKSERTKLLEKINLALEAKKEDKKTIK
jgi:hypothetical protein